MVSAVQTISYTALTAKKHLTEWRHDDLIPIYQADVGEPVSGISRVHQRYVT